MDDDVGIGGILHQKVLMVVLGGVEALERRDLGDDRRIEQAGFIELGDVGLARFLPAPRPA